MTLQPALIRSQTVKVNLKFDASKQSSQYLLTIVATGIVDITKNLTVKRKQ